MHTSRKHYQAVAAVLRAAAPGPGERMCPECGSPEDRMFDDIVEGLAGLYAADNPRFDRTRFLGASKP